MAKITLLTSTDTISSKDTLDVEESIEQMTLIASVAIGAGKPVKMDSNGKWAKALGTSLTAGDYYGLTVSSARAGEPVTAVAQGILGGFDVSALAYNADLFVDDDGDLADAAGTVSIKAAKVIPALGQPSGSTPKKMVRVFRH